MKRVYPSEVINGILTIATRIKIETKAIAWKSNSVLKVIVPNPDGKGSKLVTIPLKKEA